MKISLPSPPPYPNLDHHDELLHPCRHGIIAWSETARGAPGLEDAAAPAFESTIRCSGRSNRGINSECVDSRGDDDGLPGPYRLCAAARRIEESHGKVSAQPIINKIDNNDKYLQLI